MAKYNLIRNSYFDSLTSSGTGDVDLTWNQLESLMDGNLTSSGVTLTAPDTLYLEVDLSQRIKVDGIRLYASDLTKSANIKFYYKNSESDSYSGLATQVGSYYYTTIASPSAPRYLRATISGVAMELYEFQVFNDDYIVAFGEDGSLYSEYLDNTPVGELGSPEVIKLFNNNIVGSMPATAYACIDYTDKEGDWYVKISSSENGTYYSLNDGAVLDDNNLTSTYIWDMGNHTDTTISGFALVLDGTALNGTYVSPIFETLDGSASSYFIVDATTTSGINSVSYDAGSYNGTIRVKSNATSPIDVNEIYLPTIVASQMYLYKYNLYNGVEVQWQIPSHGTILQNASASAADRRTGHIAISFNTLKIDKAGLSKSYLYVYDSKDGSEVYSHVHTGTQYGFDTNMEFDKFGGLWGYNGVLYGASTYNLSHIDAQLINVLADIISADDFVYDLAAEMDGDGVWYTDMTTDAVVHRDQAGTVLQSIQLTTPRAICGTNDNGCWVIDNTDYYARRYTSGGTIFKSMALGRSAIRMCTDYEDGFWYVSGSSVYHLNSNGAVLSTTGVANVAGIRGTLNGCVVWSSLNDFVKYINAAGDIVQTINAPSADTGIPGVFSDTYYSDRTNHLGFIPASYDPVWGTNGSAQWKEVRKDGYFLAKDQYHQIELTLRTTVSGNSPSVDRVVMAPAVKVQDIVPQSSKDMYIRTDIPGTVDPADYETRLKVWWGVEE